MELNFTRQDCLWNVLQNENRPVFLYGTGNGADKILDACTKYNIPVGGVFASSGFVRNRTFRGMPVQSLEQIEEAYGMGLTILLCFGTTLPEVVEQLKKIAKKHKLLIPEVPLFGGDLFDFAYFSAHKNELEVAGDLFVDEASKELYQDMIAFRLSGNPLFLARAEDPSATCSAIFGHLQSPVILDGGAYKGDSARMFAESLAPSKILAAEPDPKTFQKLSAYADAEQRCTVVPVHTAISDFNGSMTFSSSGSRASGSMAIGQDKGRRQKEISVPCSTIDSLLETETKIDLIKLDVEGEEAAALDGAVKTITTHRPALAISVYHRTEDLFRIPEWIRHRYPDYRLYLRRVPCIPAWDLMVYAVSPLQSGTAIKN